MPIVALCVFFALRHCHAGMTQDIHGPGVPPSGLHGRELGELPAGP